MTKKQQAERDAVWAHIVANGAPVTNPLYPGDGLTFLLTGSASVREGARLCINSPGGKEKNFCMRVILSGHGSCGFREDRSPIAAYNALCAAPFFATTVGVAFGLTPMEVS